MDPRLKVLITSSINSSTSTRSVTGRRKRFVYALLSTIASVSVTLITRTSRLELITSGSQASSRDASMMPAMLVHSYKVWLRCDQRWWMTHLPLPQRYGDIVTTT